MFTSQQFLIRSLLNLLLRKLCQRGGRDVLRSSSTILYREHPPFTSVLSVWDLFSYAKKNWDEEKTSKLRRNIDNLWRISENLLNSLEFRKDFFLLVQNCKQEKLQDWREKLTSNCDLKPLVVSIPGSRPSKASGIHCRLSSSETPPLQGTLCMLAGMASLLHIKSYWGLNCLRLSSLVTRWLWGPPCRSSTLDEIEWLSLFVQKCHSFFVACSGEQEFF